MKTVSSPSIAEIVGGEMSPEGWQRQGAVLVTWQLGQCQSDVTRLFPKHTQSTATPLPHSAHTWGRTKVLGGISVL